MHSSRMRTICNSSHLLPGGSPHPPGSRHPLPGSRPPRADPWEQVLSQEQTLLGADPPKQALPQSRNPAARHSGIAHPLLQGMLGYHLQCMLGYHPHPVNRMTDTCKNITFATSLLTVITFS